MVSIVTAVLEATVGFLVTKGRDTAAAKLKEGDVTDERFRNMIVRELDDVKSKLDGLSRKDLLSSIGFFKEGVVYLYQAMNNTSCGDEGTVQTQAAAESEEAKSQLSLQSVTADEQIVSLVSDRRNLPLSDLNDSGKRALSKAKKRFDDARMMATEAFNNVALSTSDRILAVQYRVMSTILEEIDNPKEALPVCRLCLEELHSMPAVVKSFQVDQIGGLRSLFNKQERDEIISSVHDVNRVIGLVTTVVDGVLSSQFDDWPPINLRGNFVSRLSAATDFLRFNAPWSFGKEGKGQLECPQSITTTTHGEYIVADKDVIKVFNQSGEFLSSFIPETGLVIEDVVTDHSDNLYVLFKSTICVFDNPVKNNNKKSRVIQLEGAVQGESVRVNGEQKVFVLVRCFMEETYIVRVYEADGQFVTSFGNYDFQCELNGPFCTSDGIVIIYKDSVSSSRIQKFDAQGKELVHRVLLGTPIGNSIGKAFHLTTNYLIVVTAPLTISLYNKEYNRVRYVKIATDDNIRSVTGVTVTKEGRIAVLCQIKEINSQDFKGVVYVV